MTDREQVAMAARRLDGIKPDWWREQVAMAARRLDGIKPDWWQHVDPIRLNLLEPEHCICGQNGLRWTELFYPDMQVIDGTAVTTDRTCEPLWLEEIAKRMPAPVRERVLA